MTNASGQPLALPQVAQSRLAHDRQSGASTTAFLAYCDYLNLRQMGFEMIGGVIGISVMHIGGIQVAGMKQAVELETYSQAIGLGLYASCGRLQEEAATLDADGVFLHRIEERRVGEEHEYAFIGTAMRFAPQPGLLRTSNGLPFVFGSSVMTLYQMMRYGLVPVSFGYGICVYHVPHRTMRQALGQTFQNTEVPIFTDAWYTAREIALSRLQAQMEKQGAETVLGMDVILKADAFGEHSAEFRVSGTGWRTVPGLSNFLPVVDLAPGALIERGLLVTGPEVREYHSPAAAPPHPAAPSPAPA